MVRITILIFLTAFASAPDVSAQSHTITVQCYELDCSKCEKLAKDTLSSLDEVSVIRSDDPKLIELKGVAASRSLFKHKQELNATGKSSHQTEIEELKFRIDMNVVSFDSNGYTIDLKADLTKPLQIKKPSGMGKIFAASQPQGRERLSLSNRIVISEGQRVVMASMSKSEKGSSALRVFEIEIERISEP